MARAKTPYNEPFWRSSPKRQEPDGNSLTRTQRQREGYDCSKRRSQASLRQLEHFAKQCRRDRLLREVFSWSGQLDRLLLSRGCRRARIDARVARRVEHQASLLWRVSPASIAKIDELAAREVASAQPSGLPGGARSTGGIM